MTLKDPELEAHFN